MFENLKSTLRWKANTLVDNLKCQRALKCFVCQTIVTYYFKLVQLRTGSKEKLENFVVPIIQKASLTFNSFLCHQIIVSHAVVVPTAKWEALKFMHTQSVVPSNIQFNKFLAWELSKCLKQENFPTELMASCFSSLLFKWLLCHFLCIWH